MFVLPKGTLVHFRGMPFRLLDDAPTDGLKENYDLVVGERPRVGPGAGNLGTVPQGVDSVERGLIPNGNEGALSVDNAQSVV